MIETTPGNKGFDYAVYVFDEYVDEFPTLARAQKEAREQAMANPGEVVFVIKYRRVYQVKEKKL